MKKIIITGATSMLGISLIEECISRDIEVTAVLRTNSARSDRLPVSHRLKQIECDLRDMKSLEIERGFDCFYHLGWERTDKAGREDAQLQSVNIQTTLDCVELAAKYDCKAFVFAGSQAEYGRVQGVINNTQPVNPETAYGVAKYGAEALSKILCNKHDIRHVGARIFSTYGANDTENSMISYAVKKMLNSEDCDFTKSEQLWDYLYCGDCAEALYLIGLKGQNNAIYNIGSGVARPLKEYIEIIKELTKTKSKLNYGAIPYGDKQVMHLCADIENLKKDTGFSPKTSFTEGIKKLIQNI